MKFSIVLLYLFLYTSVAHSQINTRIETAVLDFTESNLPSSDANILAERLRYELFQLNTFTLLERGLMNEILIEQSFQQTGCVSNECIVEVGKLIGVRQIITGSVNKIGGTYTISLKLIDIETSVILNSTIEDFSGEIDGLLQIGIPNIARKIAGIHEPAPTTYPPIQTHTPIQKVEDDPVFYFQLAILYPIQLIPQSVEITGFRINALYGINRAMTGLDVGLVNHISKQFIGLQAGGINITGDMYGLQVSAYNNAHEVRGAQLGVFNSSKKVIGLQIGLINSTDDLVGIQIGLLNFTNNREFLSMVPILNIGF